MRWANDPDDPEPVAILDRHAHRDHDGRVPQGWLPTLRTHLRASANTRTGYFATVTSCVGFMDSPTVAAACRPGPGGAFNVEAFLRWRGTLYLVGGAGDKPPRAAADRADRVRVRPGPTHRRRPAGRQVGADVELRARRGRQHHPRPAGPLGRGLPRLGHHRRRGRAVVGPVRHHLGPRPGRGDLGEPPHEDRAARGDQPRGPEGAVVSGGAAVGAAHHPRRVRGRRRARVALHLAHPHVGAGGGRAHHLRDAGLARLRPRAWAATPRSSPTSPATPGSPANTPPSTPHPPPAAPPARRSRTRGSGRSCTCPPPAPRADTRR